MMYVLLSACAGAFMGTVLIGRRRVFRESERIERGLDHLSAAVKRLARSLPFVAEALDKAAHIRMQQACLMKAPELFDMLTLGLSAGMSFDGALDIYLDHANNELSRLLKRKKMSWSLGVVSRLSALTELAHELDLSVMRRFSEAVSESLTFGLPLSQTLIRHAHDIRNEQRIQLEQSIEKLPVKMLLPTGVLVVPAMLLAIMGPLLAGSLR